MNNELRSIIAKFQEKVEEANELLKKHLGIDEPHNRGPLINQVGLLGGKYKYFFHGAGCAVHFSEKEMIDFDYGHNGRIDGFDEWRLNSFVRHRRDKYPNITESVIKQWFQEAIETNEIKKLDSMEYGDLYYLVQNT